MTIIKCYSFAIAVLKYLLVLIISVALVCCSNEAAREEIKVQPEKSNFLFTFLSAEKTGISFQNRLAEGLNTNILMYEYFYNGGGVAAGDLNGDSLIDLYFTSNMGQNKLYLNKGKMQFEDITTQSGAAGREGPWKTGVTIVDINGDNKLDLYVCYSGMVKDENRVNQLFINEGNDENNIPRFVEKANEYGLASIGYSNQAYFFDYDRDGDLDALLLNHNPNSLPILNEVSTAEMLKKDDPLKGIRLLKQTKGHFDDVTQRAGISGSALTYGLGAGVADLNNDNWPDIYLSNDYAVPDYLYINNRNGTFTNKLQQSLGHTSQFSMGNDVADINNDGLPEIFTLDMLPEDNRRQKLLLAPDNYAKFDLNLRSGFYYQYMRNMLQLNNGNGTFSEVGQLAGISNTDWSWAALLADYDNDGWKDLFITNGYLRDYTNLDFIKYMDDYVKSKGRLKREDVLDLVSKMPASNVVNYIFANSNGNTFNNNTKSWGLDRPSNSNGAAYADLDNDGDLDLIVNNINQPAFIYQNGSEKSKNNNYLQIKLKGNGLNTQGLGARVTIWAGGNKQHLEQMNARGYLSSVSPVLHFGLSNATMIDSLVIRWCSGKQQEMVNLKANQVLELSEKDAKLSKPSKPSLPTIFKEISSPITYQDAHITINDFKRQPLLINQFSYSGPCMVKGDVNKDGLEDVYIGGGSGQAASLFIQQKGNRFDPKTIPAFEADKLHEDVDAIFFDANGDGNLDLYVASGGYHAYETNDVLLQDRLYINDGKGNFTKSEKALPDMRTSKSCVAANDVNQDGFIDLFVGGRVIPGRYPEIPTSYLLINDGNGNFKNEIASVAPQLEKLGMVTDAIWLDLNEDTKHDLVVVGEWMPVTVFQNSGTKLQVETKKYFDKEYSGWWNKIDTADFNSDGTPDLVIGNTGLNTQCKVSDQQPAELCYKDFDNNGSVDPLLCFYIQGKSYPYVSRDELLEQLASKRKKFIDYRSYADATLNEIFSQEELQNMKRLRVNHLKTSYFESNKEGKFIEKELPLEAQYAPVYTINNIDFDADGDRDLLLCGNVSKVRLKFGKYDANYGVLLQNDGRGNFTFVDQKVSGFRLQGDVRSVIQLDRTLLFGINEQKVTAYQLKNRK